MAHLTKDTLSKREGEKFTKKFLSMDGLVNEWKVVDNGIFIPTALVLDIEGEDYAFESHDSDDFQLIFNRVQQTANISGTKGKIQFTGHYKNTGQIKTIKLTDLEKTPEFGGAGSGEKKENLGLVFEREFFQSIEYLLQLRKEKGQYHTFAEKLIEQLSQNTKYKVLTRAIPEGENNTKRPLSVYAMRLGGGKEDIGEIVTDITLEYGKEKVYLSLKFEETLAFANIGVSTIFTEASLSKYDPNAKGMALLKTFGLDWISFCETFNTYPHSKKIQNHKKDITGKINKKNVTRLLRQMMGKGYWMVHGRSRSNVEIYEVNDSYLNRATTLTGNITAYYGGTTGKGKKVVVDCESSLYKFQFNFRNKQGKLYPSHVMCDYKKK